MRELIIRFAALAMSAVVLAACASGGGGGGNISLPNAPRAGEPPGIDGIAAADMRANFGAPTFVRKDGTVELWRYDSAACKGFFFLYPENGVMRVRHVETLPRGSGSTAADPACLSLLLKKSPPRVS